MKRSYLALALSAMLPLLASTGASATTTQHGFGFAQMPQLQADVFTPEEVSGAAYCKQTGGKVEVRHPVYGTNNSSSAGQLVLSGHAVFCRYLAKDTSRIYILVTTLNATMPTLAALAYYGKPPLSNANCPGGANPASCYCSYLGGSDQFGGATLAGGAWVEKGTADVNLDTCVFPDMSSIDSWGLAYHSNNIVRGIDLSSVLRYKNPFHH